MKFIKKLAILLGIKKEWICLKGKQLKLTTNLGWTGDYSVKYKLVEGIFTKKESYSGTLGDDASINFSVFKPKTNQTKLLVWVNYIEPKNIFLWTKFKSKTKRYLVILNKKYKKNIIIDNSTTP
jgi:hypothetical protein